VPGWEPADRLRQQIEQKPDAVVMADATGDVTARALAELVDAKIDCFGRAGIGAGHLVGSLAWPTAAFISDVFAVLALGGIVMPLPRRTSAWELNRIEQIAPLTTVSLPPDSTLLHSAAGVPMAGRRIVHRLPAGKPLLDGGGTAQLTSGTSGRTQVALRPVSALVAEIEGYQRALGLDAATVLACPVPLHHAYGFGLAVLAAPLAGARVYALEPDRPRVLLRDIVDLGVTLVAGVPPFLRVLAESARAPLPTEVGFLTAGMPIDAHTAELVGTRLGGRLGEVYGTTETGPICVRPPGPWAVVVGSLGLPLPGVDVRLIDGDFAGAGPAESGRSGLIIVRSPSAMTGYAHGEAVATGAVRDGFATGDLGRWTEAGLTIVGRVKNCINVAGAKVSPEEVETVVMEFPQVRSCLVDGVDDERLGQRIRATTTPDDVDLASLRRFCEERLSPPKQPHLYRAVPHLETTATGKVIRSQQVD
jgi:long-chain acyl-CoA synthetase